MPRSPRATMMPSAAAMMSSMSSSASCFSIFAMTGTCLPRSDMNVLTRLMSSALRTNETAT